MHPIIIADNGGTKCRWVLIREDESTDEIVTIGLSPYLMTEEQISQTILEEVVPTFSNCAVDKLFFYGTGLHSETNVAMMQRVLSQLFNNAMIEVEHDMKAVARATCLHNPGLACILGTGSNSCFYDGNDIVKMRSGIGYVLGDEGSGAYLGKKVLQYYLYKTFDSDLIEKFEIRFKISAQEIIEKVYKKPQPNKFIASFAIFLAENRGHYMVENIIEDCLNDFIINHLYKFPEVWNFPVHFSGGVAAGFQDVLKDLCTSYGIELGQIISDPMEGLIAFHKNNI